MINQAGIQLIKKYEGILDGNPRTVNLDPYLCPAGYWTIGWGHVVKNSKGEMLHGAANKAAAIAVFPNGITISQAEDLLQKDLVAFSNFVRRVFPAANDNQHAALTSFCFNLGNGRLKESQLLRLIRANPNNPRIVEAFIAWVRAGGRVLDGLVARRVSEAILYFTNILPASEVYKIAKISLQERNINLDRINAKTPII